MTRGLYGNKLVVGKPSSAGDTWNPQEYLSTELLVEGFEKMYTERGWYGGYSNDDLGMDRTGGFCSNATVQLWRYCDAAAVCI